MTYRFGQVALIGKPNAGKSTLINELLGADIAIATHKPQTTRNRIMGIHTDDEKQVVFVDTPGIHRGWTELNKAMVGRSNDEIEEADLVCWLLDIKEAADRVKKGKPALDQTAEAILESLKGHKVILVTNKMDLVDSGLALPIVDAISKKLDFLTALPVSALKGRNVDTLLSVIGEHLPEGPAMYPEDYWTDVSERFLVSEIIREKVFLQTKQELPYATTVEIEKFDESERDSEGKVTIFASIICERAQQKGILIGKGGSRLKSIGMAARKDIIKLLGCRVHLDLHVKVEKDWSQSAKGLRRVGFKA